jgi:hypothetical protein
MPKPGSVNATGLGYLRELRCQVGNFGGICPQSRRRYHCGQVHPAITGGRNAPVEDAAAMIAEADLVPLRDWYDNVFLVKAADFRRWQEMTGGLDTWTVGRSSTARTKRGGPFQAGRCFNPVHDQTAPAGRIASAGLPSGSRAAEKHQCDALGCREIARLYPAGWRCEDHKPRSRGY